jgi:NADH:ubiquinone oxidoreductase subunit F (NADH-binding)
MSAWLEGHPGLPRVLAGLEPTGKPMTLAEHYRVHGELPRRPAHELMDSIERSGLRGRGGADFPAATKLRAVAGRRRVSAVVVNGSETEPASAKDRLLLTRLPHLVLDGAMLAAEAIGAPEVIVKVGESAAGSLQALEGAISVRHDDPASVTLVAAPEGYVAGQESAVVHYLNGGAEVPTFIPPRPYERGYRRRPTLIQNPETLAQIALVARFGEHWYRELGTPADPGSVLVTISGAVAAPGVYEMAFGTPMADLLDAAGGATERMRALLVGGYFGTWVDATQIMGLRLSREELRSVGCSLGSGVLFVLGESSCGLHETARVIDYLAEQSARQCGPCEFGLRAVADGVAVLAAGRRDDDRVRERLVRWASEIRGRGACHHPDGAVRFVLSAVSVFAREIDEHRRGGCTAVPAGLPLGRERVLRHGGRSR